MAVNLDTRIPLSAIYDGPTGTERRQASQANELALRLNELKLVYENRKRKREAATDQYMGESLKRIQQGTPEQAVTDFNWNLPEQPAPMRGPMLDAPAYQRPEPLFDVQRRVTAPAVAGRQPNMEDMYAASIDALFRAGDYQGAFDAMKAMRSGAGNKYGNTLMPAYDDAGNLVYIQPGGEEGARRISGYTPAEQLMQVNQGDRRLLVGGKTGRQVSDYPVAVDPSTVYSQGQQAQRQERGAVLDVVSEAEKERIRLQNAARLEQERARGRNVAAREEKITEEVRDAEGALATIAPLKNALSKLRSPLGMKAESAKSWVGFGNPEIEKAQGTIRQISGAMLKYVERLPGAATEGDRVVFMASAGVLNDPNSSPSEKIAAADSAIASYERLVKKYSGGAAAGGKKIEAASLPAASQYPGKIATDRKTGTRYKSDGKNWVRIP